MRDRCKVCLCLWLFINQTKHPRISSHAQVILSAQTTDGKVNQVTKELFRLAPTPQALAALPYDKVSPTCASSRESGSGSNSCSSKAEAG
jgi:hypothetical protein